MQSPGARREALEELWARGLSGRRLLAAHTEQVDGFVVERFDAALAASAVRGGVALVALGGHGRRELFPFSDVDLLLLHDRKAAKAMPELAEKLLYPLWDAGFEVGHSVRQVDGAIKFAREDFIFRVSLLDGRLLAGDQGLFENLQKRYHKKCIDGRREDFVQVMDTFREERRKRFGAHSYLLEPHVKEGKGGLRDVQAMLWVAKVVFGLADPAALEQAGLLRAEERLAFDASVDMLVRVRNRLHFTSGRHCDQLFFEYQEELAAAFGYGDSDGLLAVEHFMREVYGYLRTIAMITDAFFEHVHEALPKRRGWGREKEQQLEKTLVVRGGRIHFLAPEERAARPHLLMRLFLACARTGFAIHHRARRLIRHSLPLVDESFRSSRRVAAVFLQLLTDTSHPGQALESMLETGLLGAYLPEFERIESLAQHDLYHIFTVDRHQVGTVNELVSLRGEEPELFASLARPEPLYLAALLHDVGKGRCRDHSRLGAALMGRVGRRLGLDRDSRRLLAFLVRYHLFLPENGLRRDLDDQDFILRCARLMKSEERATMLYLLSVADSRATGPSAWSDWKGALLKEFYLKIKNRLAVGLDTTDDRQAEEVEWMIDIVRQQLGGASPGISLESLPADYLFSFTPAAVVRHLELHQRERARLRQQVLVFPEKRQRSWSLLVMTTDRPGLLAKLCGVLTLHGLDVLAAQIFTWPDGTVVDVLDVAPRNQTLFGDHDWEGLARDFNLAIGYRLELGSRLHARLGEAGILRRPIKRIEPRVIIDNRASERYTVIEVHAVDRPGALYRLCQTIADFGLDIHRAKIATEVEQLIDVFSVTRDNGAKLLDPEFNRKIAEALLHIIGQEAGEEDDALMAA